jgi:hypothetical protein
MSSIMRNLGLLTLLSAFTSWMPGQQLHANRCGVVVDDDGIGIGSSQVVASDAGFNGTVREQSSTL